MLELELIPRLHVVGAMHEVPLQVDTSEIHAVVDPNVGLDTFFCHDMSKMYEEAEEAKVDIEAHVDSDQGVYRRARARESLLLAFYLHGAKATTYSLRDEMNALITDRVDPDADDTWETQHPMQFTHFVKDLLLADWRMLGVRHGAAALPPAHLTC